MVWLRIVYVDVLFMTNLAINYLLLIVTAKLSGVYASRLRLLGGAAVGALFAVCLYFPTISAIASMLLKMLLCLSISVVAFHKSGGKALLKIAMVFTGVSFAFAGGVMALVFATGGSGIGLSNGVPYLNISLKLLLAATALVYCLLSFVFGAGSAAIKRKNVEISIQVGENVVKLKGFTDSGNMAKDPISGKNIIVVSPTVACRLVENQERQLLAEASPESLLQSYQALAEINPRRYRLAACRTIAGGGSMMITISPDKIYVDGHHEKQYLIGVAASELAMADGSAAIIGV